MEVVSSITVNDPTILQTCVRPIYTQVKLRVTRSDAPAGVFFGWIGEDSNNKISQVIEKPIPILFLESVMGGLCW